MKHWLCILLLLICVGSARAQTLSGGFKPSTPEEIALAFYKTAGVTPPYRSWITEREPYLSTPPYLRPQVLNRETERLRRLYLAYQPRNDVLTIATRVRATVKSLGADEVRNFGRYELHFDYGIPVPAHFPYRFGGHDFAVIPAQLQLLENHILSENSYNYLKSALAVQDTPLTLIIQLKAREAILDAPYDIDGQAQWAFLTDIATMGLWNAQGALLWDYNAPGINMPVHENLRDLKPKKIEKMP